MQRVRRRCIPESFRGAARFRKRVATPAFREEVDRVTVRILCALVFARLQRVAATARGAIDVVIVLFACLARMLLSPGVDCEQ